MTTEKRQRQKKLTMTSCQKIVTPLSFFQFVANLNQSGSRIPDACSVNFTFALVGIFYRTKTETGVKIL